ncbi:hypothetical protein JYU34_014420 [Plutella xylostella]|uniref:ascorbate ferrireductase (transmembrane) n=1 Tax=Plutella xylostella TaxID=51655 RepID=A0ABQ7Q8A0_PLUXY|nr:uncharacterized protein LOC119690288 isoform X2 [Plutella xylostella]KAG7301462.1 hypothetical protein JYU34_014420 [Plutella xylostella]
MVLEDTKIVVLNIFNTITHMVIGGVTLVAIVFALRPGFSDDFRQHIIMCTVGYIMLMCEAVLTFNSNNAWSHTLYHSQKKVAHLAVQVAGSSLALAGCIIRISGYGGKHFSTAHGVTGWLAFILTFISLIGGVLNLYLKQHDKIIKICHASLGSATLILAATTLCLGFDKQLFRLFASDSATNILIIATVVVLVGTFYSVVINGIKRLSS